MVNDSLFAGWEPLDPLALPDPKLGPFLATNNAGARSSYGRPSHVYLVSMFHATTDVEGPVMAFDDGGYRKIWGLSLYRPAFPSASSSKPDRTEIIDAMIDAYEGRYEGEITPISEMWTDNKTDAMRAALDAATPFILEDVVKLILT